MGHIEASIHAELRSGEPMPFGRFMDRCLYDPQSGFYSGPGQAGRRGGDFITSVEVGGLFAAVIADWLDRHWVRAGRPSPWRVCEAGAGIGKLWRGVRAADPECLEVIEWTLVEQSAAMRSEHEALPGRGWRSVADLPAEPQHVTLANELLDNLAFDIAERVETGWAPVLVALVDEEPGLVPGVADPALGHLDELVPDAAIGSRVPVATGARAWVRAARSISKRVLIFDYGGPTAALADRTMAGWLRTYRGHRRGSDPLHEPGRWDITADVAIDQLPEPNHESTQAQWLVANGIEARVTEARARWHANADLGDLDALRARSTVQEADALLDPGGLGSFVALEWC